MVGAQTPHWVQIVIGLDQYEKRLWNGSDLGWLTNRSKMVW
jgi:hypothetical protein